MIFFAFDTLPLPLPVGHRFPAAKYSLVRRRVLEDGLIPPAVMHAPPPATQEQLLRVHTAEYVNKVLHGTLSEREIRRIGFPWSPLMVERSRLSTGGTIAACRAALADGIAMNLAGGTHHAYPEHGEGFCVFNDAAVATRVMQAEGLAQRVLILDLDVHQGNGTAAIFQDDLNVFTFSVHGAKNFPFHKEVSDLDVPLEDGAGDLPFLGAVEWGLAQVEKRFDPQLVVYLAGSDPYIGDRLGRLGMSKAGLAERDRIVLHWAGKHNLPIAVTMAGGYARNVQDTVDIHYQTAALAVEFSKGHRL